LNPASGARLTKLSEPIDFILIITKFTCFQTDSKQV
jgi:hypothetical protein